jgi:RimJ/RimL family protein N-acetyltransferase
MFVVRMPACIAGDDIRLRTLKITDGPFLKDMLYDEDTMKSCGLNSPVSQSWISVWWWIKKTFTLSYCIEYGSRTIGFIAVSRLTPGRSAELSLVISAKVMRRRGYGRRAFEFLSDVMQGHSFAREVFVRVRSDNPGAVLFWKNLGFSEIRVEGGIVTMSRQLLSPRACQREETERQLGCTQCLACGGGKPSEKRKRPTEQ